MGRGGNCKSQGSRKLRIQRLCGIMSFEQEVRLNSPKMAEEREDVEGHIYSALEKMVCKGVHAR